MTSQSFVLFVSPTHTPSQPQVQLAAQQWDGMWENVFRADCIRCYLEGWIGAGRSVAGSPSLNHLGLARDFMRHQGAIVPVLALTTHSMSVSSVARTQLATARSADMATLPR